MSKHGAGKESQESTEGHSSESTDGHLLVRVETVERRLEGLETALGLIQADVRKLFHPVSVDELQQGAGGTIEARMQAVSAMLENVIKRNNLLTADR